MRTSPAIITPSPARMPFLSPGVPSSSPLAPWPMNSGMVGVPPVPMISLLTQLDVERQALGSRVLGYGQLLPGQTRVLRQRTSTIDVVCISSKTVTPLGVRYLREIDLFERARDADERHRHDAGPEPRLPST